MSCWWDCTFSVIGPADQIERFRKGLPGLEQAPGDEPFWHYATVMLSDAGFLCVAAGRNYYAHHNIVQMVDEFSALTFVGSVRADMDPDTWSTFEGRSGETTWQEFTIEPSHDEMAPP